MTDELIHAAFPERRAIPLAPNRVIHSGMQIDWQLDSSAGLVTLEYGGAPDAAAWAATMREIFAHPAYRAGFGFVALLDGSDVPDVAHLAEVQRFIEQHAAQMHGARWANVTTDPAHYGMTRIAQVRSEMLTVEIQAFDNVTDAAAWAARPALRDRG